MPRHRLALASLVLSLLAAACGSDDGDGGEALNADIFTGATTTRAHPQDSGEPDASAGDEQQDALVEPTLMVNLDNRFAWCAEVQSVWDAHDQAQFFLATAETHAADALDAFHATDDELDRAEAGAALDVAHEAFLQRGEDYRRTLQDAVGQLSEARHADGNSSYDIAFRRAWSALLSTDPAFAALSEAAPADARGNITGPATTLTVPYWRDSEILADVFEHVQSHAGPARPGDRVLNPEAAEAAFGVYSQADSALIAEALAAAAAQAVEAALEAGDRTVARVGLAGELYRERGRMEGALFHFLKAGGTALVPYDASAYEAAVATTGLTIIASSDLFQGLGFRDMYDYLTAVAAWLESDPDGDLFWSTYASRTRVIQAALPAAIELAQQADAALDAEVTAERAAAQAERERRQEAADALWAASEELAKGSEAYTAFKLSFQESCA